MLQVTSNPTSNVDTPNTNAHTRNVERFEHKVAVCGLRALAVAMFLGGVATSVWCFPRYFQVVSAVGTGVTQIAPGLSRVVAKVAATIARGYLGLLQILSETGEIGFPLFVIAALPGLVVVAVPYLVPLLPGVAGAYYGRKIWRNAEDIANRPLPELPFVAKINHYLYT